MTIVREMITTTTAVTVAVFASGLAAICWIVSALLTSSPATALKAAVVAKSMPVRFMLFNVASPAARPKQTPVAASTAVAVGPYPNRIPITATTRRIVTIPSQARAARVPWITVVSLITISTHKAGFYLFQFVGYDVSDVLEVRPVGSVFHERRFRDCDCFLSSVVCPSFAPYVLGLA